MQDKIPQTAKKWTPSCTWDALAERSVVIVVIIHDWPSANPSFGCYEARFPEGQVVFLSLTPLRHWAKVLLMSWLISVAVHAGGRNPVKNIRGTGLIFVISLPHIPSRSRSGEALPCCLQNILPIFVVPRSFMIAICSHQDGLCIPSNSRVWVLVLSYRGHIFPFTCLMHGCPGVCT